jgi:hypothetical protein
MDDFLFYLGKLESIIEASETPHCFICGDFNANTRETEHTFSEELAKVCDDSDV